MLSREFFILITLSRENASTLRLHPRLHITLQNLHDTALFANDSWEKFRWCEATKWWLSVAQFQNFKLTMLKIKLFLYKMSTIYQFCSYLIVNILCVLFWEERNWILNFESYSQHQPLLLVRIVWWFMHISVHSYIELFWCYFQRDTLKSRK